MRPAASPSLQLSQCQATCAPLNSAPLTVASGEHSPGDICLQVTPGMQPGSWRWEGYATEHLLSPGVMPFLMLGSSSRGSRPMRRSWLRHSKENCEVRRGGLSSWPTAIGVCEFWRRLSINSVQWPRRGVPASLHASSLPVPTLFSRPPEPGAPAPLVLKAWAVGYGGDELTPLSLWCRSCAGDPSQT